MNFRSQKTNDLNTKKNLIAYLDLTAMGMEAGLDFTLAMDRVVRFGPKGYLGEEFAQMLREITLGKSKIKALQNLKERTNLKELAGIIQAFSISETLGGNLATTLKNHADKMRTDLIIEAEEKAQKIPIKLIFPLLLFIFPSILMILFGPIIYNLMQMGIF